MDGHITLVDTHAHLELDPLTKDLANVLNRARAARVMAIICVGIDLEDAKKALEISENHSEVYCAMGFHPHNADSVDDHGMQEMEELAKDPKVVGYGEIGLDFFRNYAQKENQIRVFTDQLRLADKLGKPIIIHLRNAYDDGLNILEANAPFDAGGVIHCFSGSMDDMKRALDMGLRISIPGPITYKKNDDLREMVTQIPDDKLLLETDCPFLAPEPFRGKTNEPGLIVHTAGKTAEIRGVSLNELARRTTANAMDLFGSLGLSRE